MKTKNIYLIPFLALLFANTALYAQGYFHFPENNAIWNTKYTNSWHTGDEIRFGMNGDTLIEDISYHKIYQLKDSTLYHPESSYYCGLREENKKIFVKFNEEDEQLLYDFNLNIGDSIRYNYGGVYNANNGIADFHQLCDTFYRKVTAIDTLTLFDGSQRRHYTLTGIDVFMDDEWIEGIGSCRWFGLFNPIVCDAYTNGDSWAPMCFKTDDEVVYLSNSDCGECFCKLYTNLETPNPLSHLISTYPNPANNSIKFKIRNQNNRNNQYELKITDTNGKLMQQKIFTKEIDINLSEFKSGLYFYSIVAEDKQIQSGKFLKM